MPDKTKKLSNCFSLHFYLRTLFSQALTRCQCYKMGRGKLPLHVLESEDFNASSTSVSASDNYCNSLLGIFENTRGMATYLKKINKNYIYFLNCLDI